MNTHVSALPLPTPLGLVFSAFTLPCLAVWLRNSLLSPQRWVTAALPFSFPMESLGFSSLLQASETLDVCFNYRFHGWLWLVKVLLSPWCWPKPLGLASYSPGPAASHILRKQGIGESSLKLNPSRARRRQVDFLSQGAFSIAVIVHRRAPLLPWGLSFQESPWPSQVENGPITENLKAH